MGVRRWILAILLALYAAQSAMVAAWFTSLKFGWAHAKGDMTRLVPLVHDTTILGLACGWAAAVLFFVTAIRLVRRKPALSYYLVAFVLSFGTWLNEKLGGVYDRVFTRPEQDLDYVLLAALVLFGLLIWLIERAGAGSKKVRAEEQSQ